MEPETGEWNWGRIMGKNERVWTIEITQNLLMGVEVSPVFKVFGTYEYAKEIQVFLSKMFIETILTKDGFLKLHGVEDA